MPETKLVTVSRSTRMRRPKPPSVMPKPPIAGVDYELNLPKEHLSVGQIETYIGCPEQYRRSYVLGEWSPDSPPLAEGRAWTRLMEKSCLRFLKKGRHLTAAAAKKLHGELVDVETKRVKGFGKDTPDAMKERGEAFILRTWDPVPDYEPVMIDGRPGVEFKIETVIAGVPILGYADLVESRAVVDFKVARTERYYDPHKSIQSLMYRWALSQPVFFFHVFCKSDGRMRSLRSSIPVELIGKWLDFMVANVARGISLGVFPPCNPQKNTLCDARWCHHYPQCFGKVSS